MPLENKTPRIDLLSDYQSEFCPSIHNPCLFGIDALAYLFVSDPENSEERPLADDGDE